MSLRRNELFGQRRQDYDVEEAAEDDLFLTKKRLEEEQDEKLDAIGQSLQRVSQLAEGFGAELRAQNDLLDEVGQDMDRTSQAIKMIEGKTKELVDQAGGPGYFCITVVLSGIAFFLFLLIIYT